MRAVAAEEAEHGVRANAVAPTAIRTADNLKAMGDTVRYVERDEIAAAVLWLCSEEAQAITSQVVQLGH
jgi:NAD(P)-dependent dehydrogenase (short-subunit alcohol dehydrogenase family)